MLSEADKLQFLQKTELFAEIPETELKSILRLQTKSLIPRVQRYLRKGTKATHFTSLLTAKLV